MRKQGGASRGNREQAPIAASAGNVTAREMQRREGGEAHGMQHREGEARARGSAGSGREEKNLDSRYHERE